MVSLAAAAGVRRPAPFGPRGLASPMCLTWNASSAAGKYCRSRDRSWFAACCRSASPPPGRRRPDRCGGPGEAHGRRRRGPTRAGAGGHRPAHLVRRERPAVLSSTSHSASAPDPPARASRTFGPRLPRRAGQDWSHTRPQRQRPPRLAEGTLHRGHHLHLRRHHRRPDRRRRRLHRRGRAQPGPCRSGRRPEAPADALAGVDAVLVGASIHVNRHEPYLVDFVRAHADLLATVPTAFFSVSLSAHGDPAQGARYIEEFCAETG